jgi:hypothetical protein
MPTAQRHDPLLMQPRRRVPDAGIEEALLCVHFNVATQRAAAAHGVPDSVGWCIESDAQTFGRGQRHTIDSGHANVDLLALFSAHGVGVGRG